MATQQEILAELIQASTEPLTDDRLRELSATAKTLASLGPAAPSITPKPKADPKAEAREKYQQLMANPLPAGARDYQKAERAQQCAELLAVVHDMVGYTDHNGHFVRTGGGPEAA